MDDLAWLRSVAADCRNCDLWEHATQTVFGDGRPRAPLMLVGEQPGDHEDGSVELLAKAMAEAGIALRDVYVTSAVKHRAPARKPTADEITACHPWLDAELDAVQPRVVCALGATAAQALFGPAFKVTEMRGQIVLWDREPAAMATVHPSSILRAPDDASRVKAYAAFVSDLRFAANAIRAA